MTAPDILATIALLSGAGFAAWSLLLAAPFSWLAGNAGLFAIAGMSVHLTARELPIPNTVMGLEFLAFAFYMIALLLFLSAVWRWLDERDLITAAARWLVRHGTVIRRG